MARVTQDKLITIKNCAQENDWKIKERDEGYSIWSFKSVGENL